MPVNESESAKAADERKAATHSDNTLPLVQSDIDHLEDEIVPNGGKGAEGQSGSGSLGTLLPIWHRVKVEFACSRVEISVKTTIRATDAKCNLYRSERVGSSVQLSALFVNFHSTFMEKPA